MVVDHFTRIPNIVLNLKIMKNTKRTFLYTTTDLSARNGIGAWWVYEIWSGMLWGNHSRLWNNCCECKYVWPWKALAHERVGTLTIWDQEWERFIFKNVLGAKYGVWTPGIAYKNSCLLKQQQGNSGYIISAKIAATDSPTPHGGGGT